MPWSPMSQVLGIPSSFGRQTHPATPIECTLFLGFGTQLCYWLSYEATFPTHQDLVQPSDRLPLPTILPLTLQLSMQPRHNHLPKGMNTVERAHERMGLRPHPASTAKQRRHRVDWPVPRRAPDSAKSALSPPERAFCHAGCKL